MRRIAAATPIARERPSDRRCLGKGLFLAAALLAGGCGGSEQEGARSDRGGRATPEPSQGFPVTVRDDGGREVVLPAPPQRIISLVPSATSILLALGQEAQFVGRTDFDDEAAVASLPSVGGGLGSSIETIVSLRPDLVVRFEAGSDATTPRRLDAAGIPHFSIRPNGIEDVMRIIGLLGQAVGEVEAADSIRASLRDELDEVALRVAGAPRPRVAILGGDPPLAAGPETFLHELVELAGGANVFADAGALYAPVSVEAVLARDLDLLLVSEGTPVPRALEAIPLRRIPLEVEIPGLGLGASARILAGLLHPGLTP